MARHQTLPDSRLWSRDSSSNPLPPCCSRCQRLCLCFDFVIDSHNANEMQSNVNTLACSLIIIMRPSSRPSCTKIHIHIYDIYMWYSSLFALFVLAYVRGQRQLKAGCLEPPPLRVVNAHRVGRAASSGCSLHVCPLFPPLSLSLSACIIQQSKKRQLSGEYCFLFALQLPFSIA